MWRDPSGVSHTVPGAPADIYFRDQAGRFWRVLRYSNVSPGGLWVSDGTQPGSRQVDIGRDRVTFLAWAEGPDGTLWASTLRRGLVRLTAQGGVRSYPAPATQYLTLDAAGRFWFICQPDLCTMTPQ